MNTKTTLLLLLAVFSFAACTEGPGSKHQVRPLQLNATQQQLCDRQNDFSVDLLRTMCHSHSGNIFISPLSVSFVSAMLANGAQGDTRQQILKAIGAEDCSLSELNAHALNLMQNLPYQDATTTVCLANAMWVDNGYPLESSFVNDVRTHYLAEVENIELSDPASANILNAWASSHTHGLVKDICDDSYFDDDLHLVLANAIYFKGQWHERFKSSNTYDQTFHTPSGDVQVPMMHGKVECRVSGSYIYDADGQMVEQGARVLRLYYKDKGYCMDIVLPEADQKIDDWADSLSVNRINRLFAYSMYESEVAMPKFSLTNRYVLNKYLQQLGMTDVFSSTDADLSGISKESQLYLALLQQDTFVEVDEDGTKAAAVTTAWAKDAAIEPGEPFVIDRPFFFFIRDVKYGIILFAGRINNPLG